MVQIGRTRKTFRYIHKFRTCRNPVSVHLYGSVREFTHLSCVGFPAFCRPPYTSTCFDSTTFGYHSLCSLLQASQWGIKSERLALAVSSHLSSDSRFFELGFRFIIDGIITLPIALYGFLIFPNFPRTTKAFYLTQEVRFNGFFICKEPRFLMNFRVGAGFSLHQTTGRGTGGQTTFKLEPDSQSFHSMEMVCL